MSKWRTTCNRNENIEFSDYHKMRNCAKLEGQSCSPYVVGCKTNINMNGMDESSPSYNRIVRPIMVMLSLALKLRWHTSSPHDAQHKDRILFFNEIFR